jgi:hypothetical protein
MPKPWWPAASAWLWGLTGFLGPGTGSFCLPVRALAGLRFLERVGKLLNTATNLVALGRICLERP